MPVVAVKMYFSLNFALKISFMAFVRFKLYIFVCLCVHKFLLEVSALFGGIQAALGAPMPGASLRAPLHLAAASRSSDPF